MVVERASQSAKSRNILPYVGVRSKDRVVSKSWF